MINRKQKEFQMDPMQLLFYQAPLSAVMLLIVVPILEPVGQTFVQTIADGSEKLSRLLD